MVSNFSRITFLKFFFYKLADLSIRVAKQALPLLRKITSIRLSYSSNIMMSEYRSHEGFDNSMKIELFLLFLKKKIQEK